MQKIQAVYIIGAQRTGVGRLYGALNNMRPDDLLATLIESSFQIHYQWIADELDAIYIGCGNQAGEDNRNIARMALLLSGLPMQVFASTVNSLCSSGADAFMQAARSIALGEADFCLAGGIESLSRSPWVESRIDGQREDSTIGWRFVNPRISSRLSPLSMPQTAELLAQHWRIGREEQDDYAFLSRQRYQEAFELGHFKQEIIPIYSSNEESTLLLDHDEQQRLLSRDVLSQLPPLVSGGKFVTLGNSARIGDGAAILALASEAYIHRHQINPLARVHSWATSAEHPDLMGIAPVSAINKALKQGKLSLADIGLWEISEAFAAQVLADIRALGLSPQDINPYGGAISIGNPLAMGSARLLVSLVHALQRNPKARYAVGASCAGLGLGTALILESC